MEYLNNLSLLCVTAAPYPIVHSLFFCLLLSFVMAVVILLPYGLLVLDCVSSSSFMLGSCRGRLYWRCFFLVADDNTSRTNHLSFFYSSSPEPPTIEAALTTKRAARRQPILSRSKLPDKRTEVQLDEGVQMISLKKDNKNDV